MKAPCSRSHRIHSAAVLLLMMLSAQAQPQPASSQTPISNHGQTESREAVPTSTAPSLFTQLVATAPDGESEAVTTKKGHVIYRRTRDGHVLRTFYACAPQFLTFSFDGSVLACAGAGNRCGDAATTTIRIWFLFTQQWKEIEFSAKETDAMTVSPERVAICNQSEIQCFRITDGKHEWSSPMPAGICDLKFSNDGAKVLASFIDGSTRDYAAENGTWRE